MKKLLNTLYVTTPEAYLALDGENVIVRKEDEVLGRVPLHTLESILVFTYPGASPALLGACAQRGVGVSFFTPHNRFLARMQGAVHGNVLLRKAQTLWSEDAPRSLEAAKAFMIGKVYNEKWVVERTLRDHPERVDSERLGVVSARLSAYLRDMPACGTLTDLRGLEAVAAQAYFSVLDEMILGDKRAFSFTGRSRRPPLDRVNALLSFAYALLARECAAGLEGVGLDPCIGFMHEDRSGRASLALDLMEELRAPVADRFVLMLINRRMLEAKDFDTQENGAVLITDTARRAFLGAWQQRKQETITHPFLEEKVPWGLVPFVQAQLLSRWIRGDLDAYPPFRWK